MQKTTILYDGWPLVYAPNSPAALHLLTLLEASQAMATPLLALPGKLPQWLQPSVENIMQQSSNTPKNRARWVQRVLPMLAKQHQVAAMHIVGERAPFNSPVPVFVSPADAAEKPPEGLDARFRAALGQGGVSRSRVLWPHDLAVFAPSNAVLVPPVASIFPASAQLPNALEDEDTLILVHGINDLAVLKKIVDMWSWAHESIGTFFPLVFAGLTAASQGYVRFYAQEYEAEESIYLLPPLPLDQLAALYEQCTAVFHPAQAAPWGDAVRQALAFGKPLISFEQDSVEAVVGPAGFLLDNDNARTLAGGVIAVTNKENVVEELEAKAKLQSAAWQMDDFKAALFTLYQKL